MELRPGVTNPELWHPERPKNWSAIRRAVVERDMNTCQFCRHQALKFMNVHHVEEGGSNELSNLATCCVACHAVQHIGRNLDLGVIEIWRSNHLSQVQIVKRSRSAVRRGKSLAEVKRALRLSPGPYAADSIAYANALLESIGSEPRAYLPKPLCAVFVNLSRWQIE
jgi:hypothetical protein